MRHATTQQERALASATAQQALRARFRDLRRDVDEYLAQYNSGGYAAVWNNLPTAAWNPDGTLGAADPTPVTTHPITAGAPQFLRTANDLGVGIAFLTDWVTWLTAARKAAIDNLVS